jgi:hypothetical protein
MSCAVLLQKGWSSSATNGSLASWLWIPAFLTLSVLSVRDGYVLFGSIQSSWININCAASYVGNENRTASLPSECPTI